MCPTLLSHFPRFPFSTSPPPPLFLCHRCRCRFMLCSPKQSPPHSGCLSDCVCDMRVCVCVCGCCLYLYSNHQTFARVSCTRTAFECDRVCACMSACVLVCVGNKFAKAKRKWLVCPARGSGVAKGWQGVAVGGNFHFS